MSGSCDEIVHTTDERTQRRSRARRNLFRGQRPQLRFANAPGTPFVSGESDGRSTVMRNQHRAPDQGVVNVDGSSEDGSSDDGSSDDERPVRFVRRQPRRRISESVALADIASKRRADAAKRPGRQSRTRKSPRSGDSHDHSADDGGKKSVGRRETRGATSRRMNAGDNGRAAYAKTRASQSEIRTRAAQKRNQVARSNGRLRSRRGAMKDFLVAESDSEDKDDDTSDNEDASEEVAEASSSSDSDSQGERGYSGNGSSEEAEEDSVSSGSEDMPRKRRRNLRKGTPPRRAARKKTSRADLQRQKDTVITVDDLTAEEKQHRLEEIVRQSEEIVKQLNADLDSVGKAAVEKSAAAASPVKNTATVADTVGSVPASASNLVGADGGEASRRSDVLLGSADPISTLPIASGLTLQPHQEEGVRWLLNLDKRGYNGILADEMGLGKTIQALAVLVNIVTVQGRGPHLVIAPNSVADHWKREAEAWFPNSVSVFHHQGAFDERMEALEDALEADEFDIFVTSHDLALRDFFSPVKKRGTFSMGRSFSHVIRQLREVEFEYLVVDEAHRLKNPSSKLTEGLRSYTNCTRRILLTGTPLSNSLDELWALLNVLNPTIFGSQDTFKQWFSSPFQDGVALGNAEKAQIVARMHTVLRPFFRRRERSDICASLAQADEVVVRCPATPLQTSLQRMFRACRRSSKSGDVLWNLRRTANHAALVSAAFRNEGCQSPLEDLVHGSGKLIFLYHALPRLLAADHRVLLFCQMRDMMDLVSDMLDLMAIKHYCLDGGTPSVERGPMIADFNSGQSDTNVFVLSTRAGGTGVNLQSSDTLILVESDWNPASDLQAVSRIQRIGQKKTVHVMRLVTQRQIDEFIVEKARKKLKMEAVAVKAGKFSSAKGDETLSRQKDIEDLLEELDAQENEFDGLDFDGFDDSKVATRAPEPAFGQRDVPEAHPAQHSSGSPAAVPVPDTAVVASSHRCSLESGASTVPSLGVPPLHSGYEDDATGNQLTKAVCSSARESEAGMAGFYQQWDKDLLRQGETSLPQSTHRPIGLPIASESIPGWLSANPSELGVVRKALKARGPMEAVRIAQVAREDAEFEAGVAERPRESRKGRFDMSFAELGSSSDSAVESNASFGSLTDEEDSTQAARAKNKRKYKVVQSESANESDWYLPGDDAGEEEEVEEEWREDECKDAERCASEAQVAQAKKRSTAVSADDDEASMLEGSQPRPPKARKVGPGVGLGTTRSLPPVSTKLGLAHPSTQGPRAVDMCDQHSQGDKPCALNKFSGGGKDFPANRELGPPLKLTALPLSDVIRHPTSYLFSFSDDDDDVIDLCGSD